MQKALLSILTCRIHNGKALSCPYFSHWCAQREINFSKGRETGSPSPAGTSHPQMVGPQLGWLGRAMLSPRMLPGTFARFLMDTLLTHLWAVLAHPLHGHVLLRAGFLAHSLVQDEAFFTRLAVGGISFTCFARGATAFTYAVLCIEAPVGRRESYWGSLPGRKMIHTWWQSS